MFSHFSAGNFFKKNIAYTGREMMMMHLSHASKITPTCYLPIAQTIVGLFCYVNKDLNSQGRGQGLDLHKENSLSHMWLRQR